MEYFKNKREMYEETALQLKGLFEDCPYFIANLANASAVLNQVMDNINWVGFYLLQSQNDRVDWKEEQEEEQSLQKKVLVLGPFQGKSACVEIKIGKGVCGTAVERNEVMLVKDVHEFPGHIACDADSRSEIVLPIYVGENIFGVLDIDSPLFGRFDEEDQAGLEKIVKTLEEMLSYCFTFGC